MWDYIVHTHAEISRIKQSTEDAITNLNLFRKQSINRNVYRGNGKYRWWIKLIFDFHLYLQIHLVFMLILCVCVSICAYMAYYIVCTTSYIDSSKSCTMYVHIYSYTRRERRPKNYGGGGTWIQKSRRRLNLADINVSGG